jgi:hypothetical protein
MKAQFFSMFTLLIFCLSCVNGQKTAESSQAVTLPDTEILLPIEEGEVYYKNKEPFGETVHLTGVQLVDDSAIFKVSESELLIKDGQLVVKNRGEKPFMRFSLPDGKFIDYGNVSFGQGPDDFIEPHLVPTTDTALLCYLFETTNQKLYRYRKSGKIVRDSFSFAPAAGRYGNKIPINIAPDDFLYVEASPTGKSIFRTAQTADSGATLKEIYSLGLNPKRKSQFSYIGNFVANPKRNRMAYAYKYFKIIKFMDLNAQTVKTVNFEKEQFEEGSLHIANGLDQNVTHYWGACAGDKYAWFLYSGRTPVDVVREQQKHQYYIYVEQYDWNGNPVHKYRLDRWGYFAVDEINRKIYIFSTNDDDPLFVFELPE